MQKPSSNLRDILPMLASRTSQSILHAFSYYLIPLGIAIFSLIALVFWTPQYAANGDVPLVLRTVVDERAALAPADALARLEQKEQVSQFDTKLSEAPVWFSFATLKQNGKPAVIDFPSRHASEIACWDQGSLQSLGAASRQHAHPQLSSARGGFALKLPALPANVLCRAAFIGPARLTVLQWPAEQFELAAEQYHRKSGLLDGGMIVLAVFVLITALINRRSLYVLFSAWLILNLRVGALSAGWDSQWLGQIVPAEFLAISRPMTFVLYAMCTLTLYQTLLADELKNSRHLGGLRLIHWSCVPLLLAAVLLPYRLFLPVMWVIMVIGLSITTIGLISVMIRSRTRVAYWIAASFAVTFVASLAEMVSAALGMRELLVINSVTAALASSLLAALAVAEQMRMETVRRVAVQQELEHTYEVMPVGVFTLDVYGHFLSANPALQKMLGGSALVMARSKWTQYFSQTVWSQLHDMVQSQAEAELEIQNRDNSRHFLVRAILARGRIEGVLQDITEQTKATEQLRFMANNDPLTKVFNRRGIEKMFEGAIGPVADGKALALAYVDLDRFKLINDLFGHTAGDEVLKQVCERMGTMLAGGHQIGRVGGDEFVIVMPNTALPLASLICGGIVDRIGNTPYRVGDKAFHVRCSIGLIEVGAGMQIKDAVSTADRACREAKTGRKEGLVVYERDASAFLEREAELTLVEQLSSTNATEGMFLEMQPIMSLKAPHDSLNFEVLLRMRERDGSVTSAGPIIAAAEKSGHAGVIDRWVLASTLSWIQNNLTSLGNTQFVCMNLSGASLNDERFVQDTIDILGRHVQVASRLCMEITESVALHDLDNTRRFIDQVRNFGVKIALDDFGAGYTSFSYLKELPADVLKIDGNFIVNINDHPANVAIVEAIVNLAVNLGMKTIAEWAEDTATVRTLAEIGVDYVQGFVVARSQSPDRMLTAASSASFIQNEELAMLVRTLGAPADVAEVHEAIPSRVHDLH
ncbi:putative bifunctional diguanylate cyclase/phosphodiesterase [Massilia eurypsychrophila]|uniref:putative bifunctional diguanylate cyclase/phosphodiesterase n=1 Tax=Massilia eurypsychrophila TaxID=1485217 RepID=UPI001E4D5419|nr:EAL domain-containing protein [Massilia eurypsychrophila]